MSCEKLRINFKKQIHFGDKESTEIFSMYPFEITKAFVNTAFVFNELYENINPKCPALFISFRKKKKIEMLIINQISSP